MEGNGNGNGNTLRRKPLDHEAIAELRTAGYSWHFIARITGSVDANSVQTAHRKWSGGSFRLRQMESGRRYARMRQVWRKIEDTIAEVA